MKLAILMTYAFLALLTLSFLTYTILTAIRKAEWDESAVPAPADDKTGEQFHSKK